MLKPSTCFRNWPAQIWQTVAPPAFNFAMAKIKVLKWLKKWSFMSFIFQSLWIRSMLCQWKRMLSLFASSTRSWTARMCQATVATRIKKPRWRKSITGKQIKSQLQTGILMMVSFNARRNLLLTCLCHCHSSRTFSCSSVAVLSKDWILDSAKARKLLPFRTFLQHDATFTSLQKADYPENLSK